MSQARWFHPKTLLDKTFEISILLKAIDSALEVIGGILLLAINPATINRWASALFEHELSQDPRDFIARHIVYTAQHLSDSRLFGAVYLLSHGLIKLVLIIALLRGKLWAYPAIIVLLLVFIEYQVYRVSLDHSIGLFLLTIFDAFVA